jgi:hypothetical protein
MRHSHSFLFLALASFLALSPARLHAGTSTADPATADVPLPIKPARAYFAVSADTPEPAFTFRFNASATAGASAFNATPIFRSVATEITVSDRATAASDEGFTHPITTEEVETSAGTFGDISRFVQTLAGVVNDNDQRNDFLVRGGNPTENLFVIDNIDVPSINQLALSDTTGGFVSMLDVEAVQQFDLHTDAYDERFDQRLSSVLEVSTRPSGPVTRHNTSEAGIAGVGGSITRPLGSNGSYFFSVREGILQYLTNDIGMNGVPHYRNAFFRAEQRLDDRNTVWGISLTGIDSIQIHPSAGDPDETSPFDIGYSGWRNTTGINWQHVFSSRAYGTASLAHAAQHQSVAENGQLQLGATIYNENTTDNISTLKYDFAFQPVSRLTLTTGTSAAVDQLSYSVAQPIGLQNPYSTDPAALDATAFTRQFAPFSSAAYVQAAIRLPRNSTLVLGERGQQWALGGHAGATSKALFSVPIAGKLTHFGFADYQQLPATLYLLSFNNIQSLKPIRCRQLTAGITLADNPRARLTFELYQKRYTDYPVATKYPQLSLANIADTFGQAFLMFPMTAQGTGIARGAELSLATHVTADLTLTGTLTYARDQYAGLDGILRSGNYDLPLQANFTGVWRMVHKLTFSWRYTVTSGVPYTPDNLPLSYAQNRDVYDLNQINAVRAPAYRRLDFRIEQTRRVGLGQMTWHAGLENALNNQNFYDQLWQPRIGGDAVQTQMPLFPDGGVKFVF